MTMPPPDTADHVALIAGLDARIEAVLGPLIRPGERFALVDFPYHSNVGDSAIWAGQLAFFARRGQRPSLTTLDDVPATRLRQAIGDGTIFISGGGNFGDVWPPSHALRLRLLREMRGNRIVQLPQSIHFGDAAGLAETAEAIAAHGNMVLLVRDLPSQALARRHFRCETLLCPDLAFCLGPQVRRGQPTQAVVVLARTDRESLGQALPPLPETVRRLDWLEAPAGFVARLRRGALLSSPGALGLQLLDREAQRERFWRILAQAQVERGLALLSSGRRVATDRLHAHILCVLLGVPHVVADNSYGKLGNFLESWTAACPLVRRAPDLSTAVALATAS